MLSERVRAQRHTVAAVYLGNQACVPRGRQESAPALHGPFSAEGLFGLPSSGRRAVAQISAGISTGFRA